ncbi:MAG: undecaprenyl-diphosphate phosphatase [Acidimicrobiia bacterium]
MLAAIIWGLVQGLAEFLPVSSSGHLVVVPEFLDQLGLDIEPPSLAVSAVLHLGTLIAVLAYFRADVMRVLRLRRDPEGRKIATLVAVGTIPALAGFPLKDTIETLQEDVTKVGVALIATGVILLLGQRFAHGRRQVVDASPLDAFVIGVGQALALVPGISRSGATIATGNGRGLEPSESARFAFLLGIPTIAGAGLLSLPDLLDAGTFDAELVVALVVAAVSGYAAIAFLLSAIRRVGLIPFAIYCFIVGTLTIAFL